MIHDANQLSQYVSGWGGSRQGYTDRLKELEEDRNP